MDDVESVLMVTEGALSGAHCYSLNSEETLYRISGQSHKFELNLNSTPVLEPKTEIVPLGCLNQSHALPFCHIFRSHSSPVLEDLVMSSDIWICICLCSASGFGALIDAKCGQSSDSITR